MLEVRHVAKQFGGLRALSDISFKVEKDQTVGIIGPNGAGKTTAFNVVTGTLKPTEGQIFLAGQEITGLAPSKVVSLGLARTFQQTTIYANETVEENVRRGTIWRLQGSILKGLLPQSSSRRAAMAADMANVDEIIETLGLQSVRDRVAGTLSYGLQKKVGVAIGLATRPKLLLMDEPAAGLNSQESHEFGELITIIKQRYNLTVLLVEHHIALVRRISSKIIVIAQGRVIAEGAPDEVLSNPQVIESYLGTRNAEG
ncbi:ABC transporter ATP-binding protein [Brucella thiophenivorans]|nr:ABC transporter ATP-binding protein [Brucella thiophenivorans]